MRILKKSWWMVTVFGLVVFGVWNYSSKLEHNRKPASVEGFQIGRVVDFKKTVINQLRVRKVDEQTFEVAVQWPGDICNRYSDFDMIVEADGVAISGEPVQIRANQKCVSGDQSGLQTSWQFGPTIAASDDYELKNVSQVGWKQNWFVRDIVLHGVNGQAETHINSYEIVSLQKRPLGYQF